MTKETRAPDTTPGQKLQLGTLQAHFMGYLLSNKTDTQAAHHSALTELTTSGSPSEGLQIYAHAYTTRLVEALRTDHEKLSLFLGEPEFTRLATQYVADHPSSVRSLRDYGDALPSFLAASGHLEANRAAQLAEFERLLLDVYDAADAEQLDPDALQKLGPEQWPSLRLAPHPSARLFIDSSNAIATWQRHHGNTGVTPNREAKAGGSRSDPWLVWRDRERICQFRHIEAAEHEALVLFLLQHHTLAEVAEALSETVAADQLAPALQQWLHQWLADGLVTELHTD